MVPIYRRKDGEAPAGRMTALGLAPEDDTYTVTGGTGSADTTAEIVSLGSGFDHLIVDYSQMTEAVASDFGASFGANGASNVIRIGGVERLTYYDIERLTITTGSANDIVYGVGDDDTISTQSGNDTIVSALAAGRDRIDGGAGVDTAIQVDWSDLTQAEAVVFNANVAAGVTIGAGASERYLRGIEQLVNFYSGAGNDLITLSTDASLRNAVYTGAGDDTVAVYGGATAAATAAASIVDMGSGSDRLVVDYGAATQAVTFESAPQMGGLAASARILLGGVGTLDFLGVERLTLTTGSASDNVYGTAGDDVISTGGGADVVATGSGNDILDGGAGADALSGGQGDDTYYLDDAGDTITEAIGEGFDMAYTSVSYTLAADAEIEILSVNDTNATIAISLTGNAFGQQIFGNEGDNVLTAGGGVDALYGFGGNDIYSVDALDVVVDGVGQGFDIVYSSATYAINAGAEIELLSVNDFNSTNALNLIGNEFGQQIFGNAGNNVLTAGGGVDALYGFGGNDVYSVDALDIVVDGVGQGFDIVYSSATYAINAGAEIELLSVNDFASTNALNLIGNEFGQQIFGNDGDNNLTAGGGVDALYGRAGNDTYSVDALDVVFDGVGQGFDIVYSSATYAINAGAEIEILSVNDFASTNALNLIGNEFGQQIFGNDGDNNLTAGAGADALYGRAGNDVYSVDALDTVIDGSGQGFDIVYSAASYALNAGAEIEILSVSDSAATTAINLTGNEFGQQLIGNAGANILNGNGGNDLLVGNGGADIFAFTIVPTTGNVATIADFQTGIDKIRLGGDPGQPFAALATGAVSAGAFVIGSAALQADDVLIYDSATGALLYDADGSGSGAAVQVATLSTGLNLTAADFTVSGAANHAPTISSGTTATVAENTAASTIVYQTAATDSDGDRIAYTLTGTDASLLTIDANGAVRLLSSANYEAKKIYFFNVVASDSGTSATKAVTLTITDVNENTTPIINETPALNNDIATAQEIHTLFMAVAPNPELYDPSVPSATIRGSISNNIDKDYYSISLSAGGLLILDVDGTGNGLDTVLRLYSPGGSEILSNDDLGLVDAGSTALPGTDYSSDSFIRIRVATAGTYYFSIESFSKDTSGSYDLNISVGPAATAAQIMNEDVQSLISGYAWDHNDLSYGFPTSAGQYPGTEFVEVDQPGEFTPFTATQIAATTQLLQIIANVSDLTFQRDTAHPGDADLRYGMSNEPEVAYAYYPTNEGPTSPGGSAWFNKLDFNAPVRGSYDWMGILHETGHALGLKHGHEMPSISTDHDSLEYTVMTYRSHPEGSVEGGYGNETWGFPQTLMMLDIAALQKMYGANYGFNASNSVYSWSSSTGEMSINGVGQGRPGDSGNGSTSSSANRVFMTVWDGGGADTYDMSNYGAGGVRIDLRPGEWSKTSTVQLANLGDGVMARGNVANALMFNGDTASLIENAIGSTGGDRIIANQVANQLTGNAGNDVFQWKSHTDAGIGTLADRIADFLSGQDKIDLGEVDSYLFTTSTNETFTFIGTAAFTGMNQLRYEVIDGNAHVYADVNNNHVADFEIILNNVTSLTSADFIL